MFSKRLVLFVLLSMGILYACSKKAQTCAVAKSQYAVTDAASKPVAGARIMVIEYTK
jgi:hypothetical protein